ncbi:MAG: divalent metal cation transporter [Actinobacteria bacterium]|nr:MAG: divalent metal cation transporter [Actinomycetota bacterium]
MANGRVTRVKDRLATGRRSFLLLMAVLGPGLITASADNDAGGISTYSIVGARFGYALLWTLPLILLSLGVTQEMGARMGLVTRKGLGALIRERFGLRWTTFAMLATLVANFGTTIAEFAGIAAAMELFGVSKYVAVPALALLVYLLVVRASYRRIERIFLISSVVYLSYVISGILARPDWPTAFRMMSVPTFQPSTAFIFAFVATVGTTITPWGQFFIQSYVVDKGLTKDDITYERVDVYFGAFVTQFIAFFIIVACAATIFARGLPINDAADAARALAPLAGPFASSLFAFGLLNASLLGAAVLPLSTAYATCEAFGWEAGVDQPPSEAPIFYGLYRAFIVLGAALVLIPGLPLIQVMYAAAAVNGILLPVILVYTLVITNDRGIMGAYINGRVFNVIAWITVMAMIALTAVLLAFQFLGFG